MTRFLSAWCLVPGACLLMLLAGCGAPPDITGGEPIRITRAADGAVFWGVPVTRNTVDELWIFDRQGTWIHVLGPKDRAAVMEEMQRQVKGQRSKVKGEDQTAARPDAGETP